MKAKHKQKTNSKAARGDAAPPPGSRDAADAAPLPEEASPARGARKRGGKGGKPAKVRAQRMTGKQKRRLKKLRREERAQHVRVTVDSNEGVFNTLSQFIHDFFVRGLSNLRFSLSLRISFNYARRLVSMLLSNLVVLFIVFALWQTPMLLARNAQVAQTVAEAGDAALPLPLAYRENVRVRVLPGERPAPANWLERNIGPYMGSFQTVEFEGWHPLVVFEEPWVIDAQPHRLRIVHDVWGVCVLFAQLMLALLVFDVLRALWFLVAGRQINRQVLQPIADITAHAQMLSENDLSLRLNVAGTKNELRDLAVVLNAMLDRIEAAYNGQKQFVSDASHELRTPIAVIQGYANLLERWGKDAPQVRDEAIAAIVNETASMKELVEKLLFLARHDKKTFKLNPEHFEVRALVEETIRETELITVNHRVETGTLTSGILYADRNAIKQAIRIFIDNAVKYTPPGGTLRIACERRQGQVAISVSDTGVGIAREDLPSIFDRFYRADAARASTTGGHGLGLSIAKIIVLSHGGKIKVYSQKGAGTTFCILLPS